MENYKIYKVVMNIVFVGAALIVIISILNEDSYDLLLLSLIMMPLGVFQLGVGIHFITTLGKRSESIKAGFRTYWILTFGYFLVLYAASRFDDIRDEFYQAYLFAVPWVIAIYQYLLVQKSKKEREVSLNETVVS